MLIGIDPVAVRAYLAGLIDGEGYIGVKRRMPSEANKLASPKYSPCVSLSMTDFGPVKLMADFCTLGEQIVSRKRTRNLKIIYQFDLENHRAAAFLREIRPYLIGKAEQADRVLSLADLRSESRSHRTKVVSRMRLKAGRNAGTEVRLFGLSDEFTSRCDAIYQACLMGMPRSGNGARFKGAAC